jgi:hypothetical protein
MPIPPKLGSFHAETQGGSQPEHAASHDAAPRARRNAGRLPSLLRWTKRPLS